MVGTRGNVLQIMTLSPLQNNDLINLKCDPTLSLRWKLRSLMIKVKVGKMVWKYWSKIFPVACMPIMKNDLMVVGFLHITWESFPSHFLLSFERFDFCNSFPYQGSPKFKGTHSSVSCFLSTWLSFWPVWMWATITYCDEYELVAVRVIHGRLRERP